MQSIMDCVQYVIEKQNRLYLRLDFNWNFLFRNNYYNNLKIDTMEKSKIDMFFMANQENFAPAQMVMIKQELENMSDDSFMSLQSISFKKPLTLLLVSIFLGELGVDRFMLGDTGLGIAKLLTCGGCYIWWIIDLFSIQDKTREYNFRKYTEWKTYNSMSR